MRIQPSSNRKTASQRRLSWSRCLGQDALHEIRDRTGEAEAAGENGKETVWGPRSTRRQEYRYNRLTWAEMNDAIARQQVVILPTGSTEQHGRHLPLDVDLFLCESVCLEVGRRAAGGMLVLPPIPYGLNLHHIDFPGTIHIEPEVFIAFCLNVTKSVAYHGFEKILIVNGHGSNAPLIDLIARRTTLETESLCAACHYIILAVEEFREIKETQVIAHADEFETSLYLHLAPERVQMDKAGADDDVMGHYVSSDSTDALRPLQRLLVALDRPRRPRRRPPGHRREGRDHLRDGGHPPGRAGGRVARLADRRRAATSTSGRCRRRSAGKHTEGVPRSPHVLVWRGNITARRASRRARRDRVPGWGPD